MGNKRLEPKHVIVKFRKTRDKTPTRTQRGEKSSLTKNGKTLKARLEVKK